MALFGSITREQQLTQELEEAKRTIAALSGQCRPNLTQGRAMADLLTKLRNIADQPYRIGGPTCDVVDEAVAEIERLRAAIKTIVAYESARK